jgi:hypothetical protein
MKTTYRLTSKKCEMFRDENPALQESGFEHLGESGIMPQGWISFLRYTNSAVAVTYTDGSYTLIIGADTINDLGRVKSGIEKLLETRLEEVAE